MGNLRIPDAYTSGKAALERAREIDAKLPEAKCASAWLEMMRDRNWRGARKGFDECLADRDHTTRALVGRAMLFIAERSLQDASKLLYDVIKLRPLNALVGALYCWSTYLDEDYRTALDFAEEMRASGSSGPVLGAVESLAAIHCDPPRVYLRHIETTAGDWPQDQLLQGILGYAYALNGRTSEAKQILHAMTHLPEGEKAVPSYAAALVLAGLGEFRDAVQWLETSFRRGSLWSMGFLSDPALRRIRDDSSYRDSFLADNYPSIPETSQGLMTSGSRL